MPRVHRFASLLKRRLLATYQGAVARQHPQSAIPDPAGGTPEDLTATLMTAALRGMFVLLALEWGVVVPFLNANKKGSVYMTALGTVTMLVVPYLLLRRGRARLAARVFLASSALCVTVVVLLGRGGVNNIGTTMQLAIVVIAVVLLGRRGAMWIAVPCLAADLASAIAEFLGHPLPIVFPIPPLTAWVMIAIFFMLTAFPLNRTMRTLQNQIAERREVEQELRRQAQIADQAHDSIVCTNLDGLITNWNQGAQRMFGYTAEEAVARHVEFLYPEDEHEFRRRQVIEPLMVEGTLEVEARMLTKSGAPRMIHLSLSLLRNEEGHVSGIVGCSVDITGRKELEERLSQTQKMESIGRLAGGVAHDFNNLLTVINGYSQIALRKVHPTDPLRKPLELILQAGEQAAGLTNQLLAFSRQQKLQPRVIDLNHVLDELRPMLVSLVPENIDLQFALGADIATTYADPSQMQQMIMNLVGNASDAMPLGGRLLLQTARVERDLEYVQLHPEERAGRHVELTVTDMGTGMDEQTRQHIFEPFFTTKGVGKGTGLGLSMVQGIVEQSGGYITVNSNLGHGTIFRIYLPESQAAPDSVATVTSQQAAPPVTGRKTVLVVEDQAAVRAYVALALETEGYQALTADSGAAAIAIWEKQAARIDLVLTDLVMPGMNGRQLANHLRQIQPDLKVLFMSGYTDDKIGLHELSSPELIMKPFRAEQLAARIHGALVP